MSVENWLESAADRLEQAGIATARLDALILVEDVMAKDRAWLLAHPEYTLEASKIEVLDDFIARRAKHEPLAYIRGKSEFYGREFKVTPATLQPRPETETMVELFLEQVKKSKIESVVDVGTGSGCLAITAKLELPEMEIFATEINKEALKIAKENAQSLGTDVKFYQGNLLDPILKLGPCDLILANLPYVPDAHTINQAAMQEPKVAIFGGKDGLDLYRELFEQLASTKYEVSSTRYVLTESLPFQHESLAAIAKLSGYKLQYAEDFIQIFTLC